MSKRASEREIIIFLSPSFGSGQAASGPAAAVVVVAVAAAAAAASAGHL